MRESGFNCWGDLRVWVQTNVGGCGSLGSVAGGWGGGLGLIVRSGDSVSSIF